MGEQTSELEGRDTGSHFQKKEKQDRKQKTVAIEEPPVRLEHQSRERVARRQGMGRYLESSRDVC